MAILGEGFKFQKYTLGNDTNIVVVLLENIQDLEVVVLGSRSAGRSRALTVVPVDVFNIKKLWQELPQVTLTDILNNLAPSFTAPNQILGGTDHVEPASIRGLGTDQTLVLINGKRRHTIALVNVYGNIGRGSVGTDLNAIPANAVDKIELLRDGASAQYGSDAIAGVLNIQLIKNVKQVTATMYYGFNNTVFKSYTQANRGNFQDHQNPVYVNNHSIDGQRFLISLNYGWQLGKFKTDFVNFSMLYESREPTIRSGELTGNLDNRTPGDLASTALLNALQLTRNDFKVKTGQSGT
ncbi:MAG: TonB-dependent receptor plug domain-containing protein [Alphaproteobacteria bacterium]|nr:TonB-dependent receptor plug domain-containing protein [Alphaproteobacteria bacterium]